MRSKLIFILILAIFAKEWICFSSDELSKLCIKIEPLKKSYNIKEDIIIRVTIINCGKKILYILPYIDPESFYIYEGCFSVLKFDIKSSSNKKIQYKYNSNIYHKYKLPSLEDFFPFAVNYFYGAKIVINKGIYEYGPFEEGKYKIKAVYSSKARSCNMKRYEKELNSLSSNIDKEKLYNIFEGEIYSNEIEIEIIK